MHCYLQSTELRYWLQDLNFGGSPQYPYRHPIIQTVINLTWFQNKDDVGIAFYDYFEPIPIEAITVALTVVRVEATRPYPRLDADGLYSLSSDRVLH